MEMPEDQVIHCHACSKYVKLAEGVQEGDVVDCPFCHSKNQVRIMAVYVGRPVEEA